MARGSTLTNLLRQLRVEARLSSNPAHNIAVRDNHVERLQAEQQRLWEDYDWPHLRVERVIKLLAGQRFYDPPEELDVDRIEKIEFKRDGDWITLDPEIDARHYALYDSSLDERSWPQVSWRLYEGEQIEIWPVPDRSGVDATQEGYIKLTGIKKLRALVADGDEADLDDRLITLYVAGALLAAAGAKDAQLVLEKANKRLATVKGNLVKKRSFSMFSATSQEAAPRRRAYAIYNRTT